MSSPTHRLYCWFIVSNCILAHRGRYKMTTDDMFLNEHFWTLNKISLKYVHCCLIDSITALVQILALRRTVSKPLSITMLASCTDAYMRHLGHQWVKCMFLGPGQATADHIVYKTLLITLIYIIFFTTYNWTLTTKQVPLLMKPF